VGARQVRKHVHHQGGIGQAFELAVDLVLRRAAVGGLVSRRPVDLLWGQRATQRLTCSQEFTGAAAATAATPRFTAQDVEHGLAVVGEQFVLGGGAAGQQQCAQNERCALYGEGANRDPNHGSLRVGD